MVEARLGPLFETWPSRRTVAPLDWRVTRSSAFINNGVACGKTWSVCAACCVSPAITWGWAGANVLIGLCLLPAHRSLLLYVRHRVALPWRGSLEFIEAFFVCSKADPEVNHVGARWKQDYFAPEHVPLRRFWNGQMYR